MHIAIGPELPEFGSWNWLGLWMTDVLAEEFRVSTFRDIDRPPDADLIVFLKFKPAATRLIELRRRSRLAFLPVDVYGSTHEIDADLDSVRSLDLILLHSQRLIRYFHGVAKVAYLDHPLKFVLPVVRTQRQDGPLLWVGKKCNLAPVIPWLTHAGQSEDVWVLTDTDNDVSSARSLGFSTETGIRIGKWSPDRHLEWLQAAKAAVDIKGTDFRSRHKPPAKALDFLASGVPVITNRGSSVDLHFQRLTFPVLYSSDWAQRYTAEYQQQLSGFAMQLRRSFSAEKLAADLVRLFSCLTQQAGRT